MRRIERMLALMGLMACISGDSARTDTVDAVQPAAADSLVGGQPRLITSREWEEITPVVRAFLEAVRQGDEPTARALATDSVAAVTAISRRQSSPVVASALDSGMRPLNGGWDGDTLVVVFAVPGRSMQDLCYNEGATDALQVHLRRVDGRWRVYRVPGRYC